MRGPIEEIVFFGDDVRIGRFPAHTRFVYANEALAALPDFDAELRAASTAHSARNPWRNSWARRAASP